MFIKNIYNLIEWSKKKNIIINIIIIIIIIFIIIFFFYIHIKILNYNLIFYLYWENEEEEMLYDKDFIRFRTGLKVDDYLKRIKGWLLIIFWIILVFFYWYLERFWIRPYHLGISSESNSE